MFISNCITHKAISSLLVAAVASAAAVAVASAVAMVPLAGAGVEVVVGATVAIRTTSELFEVLLFHNSLEIIFRNFNNSFLTSIISLQATFGI